MPARINNSGIHPPIPNSSDQRQATATTPTNRTGQRLQLLLRRLYREHNNKAGGTNNGITFGPQLPNEKLSEKDDVGGNSIVDFEEAIRLLQNLVSTVQRSGLIQGDVELATSALTATSSNSNAGSLSGNNSNQGKRPNKRSRNNQKNNDLTIHDKDLAVMIDVGTSSSGTTTVDVQLIMSSLARLLSINSLVPSEAKLDSENTEDIIPHHAISDVELDLSSRMLLVMLAANVCTVQCEFVMTTVNDASKSCSENKGIVWMAEYELLASLGKTILSGLHRILSYVTSSSTPCPDKERRSCHIDKTLISASATLELLTSCLRASSSLVSLFGTKLSRSATLLSGLAETAWDAMMMINHKTTSLTLTSTEVLRRVQCASNALLYEISVIASSSHQLSSASSSSTTPFLLSWERLFQKSTACLFLTIQTTAPVTKKQKSDSKVSGMAGEDDSDALSERVKVWLENIKHLDDEDDRVESVLLLFDGLAGLIMYLLQPQGNTFSSPSLAMYTSINLQVIVDLVDTMISFSLASEATYIGTKKRLRQEPVNKGFISITSLVSHLANAVKLHGIHIMESVIVAFGGPTLLPFELTIKRVGTAALLTSVSTALRTILDPTSSLSSSSMQNSNDGGKGRKKRKAQQKLQQQLESNPMSQRWLHSSVVVRSAAINLFRVTTFALGVDFATKQQEQYGNSNLVNQNQTSETTRGISLVAGCMVEQLVGPDRLDYFGDWGSSSERLDVLIQGAKCLIACLLSGGEYLALPSRTLMDSITCSCLSAVVDERKSSIPLTTEARSSFLSLGSACVSTPWPDGASCSTSVVNLLRQASRHCCDSVLSLNRGDDTTDGCGVVEAARAAMTLCEHVLPNPRVPALLVVTRSTTKSDDYSGAVGRFQGNQVVLSADDFITKLRQTVPRKETTPNLESQPPEESLVVATAKKDTDLSTDVIKESKKVKENMLPKDESTITIDDSKVEVTQSIVEDTSSQDLAEDKRPTKIQALVDPSASYLAHSEQDIPKEDIENEMEQGDHNSLKSVTKEDRSTAYDPPPMKKQVVEESDGDGDEFPMIVDCDPDDGDED